MSKKFYDEIAEQELLGFLLIDNNFLDKVIDRVTKDVFYFSDNATIFECVKNLIVKQSKTADLRSVLKEMQKKNVLNEEEREGYLNKLIDLASVSVSGFESSFNVIEDCFLRRSIAGVIETLGNDIEPLETLTEAEKKIYSIIQKSDPKSKSYEMSFFTAMLEKKIDRIKNNTSQYTGTETGFVDFDKFVDGVHDSDLIILAARPSMGKTALAVNIAFNIANFFVKNNIKKTVGFFSLEMSGEQIASRIVSLNTSVDSSILRTGKNKTGDKASDKEYQDVLTAISEISEVPLLIDDTSSLDVDSFKIKARHMKIKHNIGFLVVDYLQLMRVNSKKGDNRVNEVSEITQSLKAIAKDLNIPVVALSQLSREVEKRDDKKPQLSDLRESGSIEQDADLVIFLYREVYYHERNKPKLDILTNESDFTEEWYSEKKEFYSTTIDNRREAENTCKQLDTYMAWHQKYKKISNIAELVISKNRHGPTGSVTLGFNKDHTKFYNYIPNIYGDIFKKETKSIQSKDMAELQSMIEDVF